MAVRIDRRTLLRASVGVGAVAVGLPLLESMLAPSGQALANGDTLPRFFGMWFTGNGVAPEAWYPGSTGSNWGLPSVKARLDYMREREVPSAWADSESAYLYPDEEHGLARFVEDARLQGLVNVVTGMKIPHNDPPQHRSHPVLLTGAMGQGTNMRVPTADQLVAESFGERPLLLQVDDGLELATSDTFANRLSWRQEGDAIVPVTPYTDARQAFDDLFEASQQSVLDRLARRSVLDYLMPQITDVQSRVSAADQRRLDQHFTAIRELEIQLGEEALQCTPEAPEPTPVSDLRAGHLAMARVAALALACGARRTFQLVATRPQCQYVLPGSSRGQHSLQHAGFLGDNLHTLEAVQAAIANQNAQSRTARLAMLPQNRRAVRFQMDLFADMVEVFADTSHGGGSLLDACAIVGGFSLWNGNHHGYEEQAAFTAGSAHGRLVQGQHIHDPTQTNPAELMLSIMRAAMDDDAAPDVFGDGGAYSAADGFSPVEA